MGRQTLELVWREPWNGCHLRELVCYTTKAFKVTHRFRTPGDKVLIGERDVLFKRTLLHKAVLNGFHVGGVVTEACIVTVGGTRRFQVKALRRTS